MRAWTFRSCLAQAMQNFVSLRQLSGTDYHHQAQLLGYFDRFLSEEECKEPRITRQLTDGYVETLSHLAPRTRENRFCVVRQLCQYLSRSDPLGYVPESLRTTDGDRSDRQT